MLTPHEVEERVKTLVERGYSHSTAVRYAWLIGDIIEEVGTGADARWIVRDGGVEVDRIAPLFDLRGRGGSSQKIDERPSTPGNAASGGQKLPGAGIAGETKGSRSHGKSDLQT